LNSRRNERKRALPELETGSFLGNSKNGQSLFEFRTSSSDYCGLCPELGIAQTLVT
jgi:hypothetical protein